MLTPEFYEALKNVGQPYHKIAWGSGLTPNQVYKITAGIDRPGKDDKRLKALCQYLNLPIEAAFEDEQ